MVHATKAISKCRHRLLPLLIIFAVVYGFCFEWQFLVSLGMGPDNIEDMTFGLLPGVGAVVLSLALYWKHLSPGAIIPPALIGLGWIITLAGTQGQASVAIGGAGAGVSRISDDSLKFTFAFSGAHRFP